MGVQLRSHAHFGERPSNIALATRRSPSSFVRYLIHGKPVIQYRMRAEIPGTFHAFPTKGSAMYAPELRANSDEAVVRVAEEGQETVSG